MDFTSEQNAEDSNHQTNTNDKLFDVSGEALALAAELVGNQVWLPTAVLFQYFHDGFFLAYAESNLMLTHQAGPPILDPISVQLLDAAHCNINEKWVLFL